MTVEDDPRRQKDVKKWTSLRRGQYPWIRANIILKTTASFSNVRITPSEIRRIQNGLFSGQYNQSPPSV